MAATAISSIPAAAGGAFFAALGRGLFWLASRIIKAPVSSTMLIAMTMGTALAATNALYFQVGQHPAPMFAPRPLITSSVTPAQKPVRSKSVIKKVTKPLATKKFKVLAPIPAVTEAVAKISNQDVKALQEKLLTLKFYDGDADGFYGPQTATAIRDFENSIGATPIGALTPDVLKAIKSAKLPKTVTKPRKTVTKSVLPSIEAKPQASVSGAASSTGKKITTAKLITTPKAKSKTKQIIPNGLTADPLVQIVQRVASAAQKSMGDQSLPANAELVEKIQRGLSSLGFLRSKIDGIAGSATAKAIRNFETYYNYDVTGAATPELVDLLTDAGAKK